MEHLKPSAISIGLIRNNLKRQIDYRKIFRSCWMGNMFSMLLLFVIGL